MQAGRGRILIQRVWWWWGQGQKWWLERQAMVMVPRMMWTQLLHLLLHCAQQLLVVHRMLPSSQFLWWSVEELAQEQTDHVYVQPDSPIALTIAHKLAETVASSYGTGWRSCGGTSKESESSACAGIGASVNNNNSYQPEFGWCWKATIEVVVVLPWTWGLKFKCKCRCRHNRPSSACEYKRGGVAVVNANADMRELNPLCISVPQWKGFKLWIPTEGREINWVLTYKWGVCA